MAVERPIADAVTLRCRILGEKLGEGKHFSSTAPTVVAVQLSEFREKFVNVLTSDDIERRVAHIFAEHSERRARLSLRLLRPLAFLLAVTVLDECLSGFAHANPLSLFRRKPSAFA